MSRTLSRVAGGALAILVSALVGNVAIARAQTSATTEGGGGVPAISTDCGSGTILQCATEKTFKCELSLSVSYMPGTYLPVLSFSQTNCVESGTRPIYKDKYPSIGQIGNLGCTGSKDEEPEMCI